MSKTRGNVVDPLAVIESMAPTALRFHADGNGRARHRHYPDRRRILSYRAFANKIWNAARFIFVNLEKIFRNRPGSASRNSRRRRFGRLRLRSGRPSPAPPTVGYFRLAEVTATVNEALKHYRFHEAAHVIYHFFWGDFCDWYIEWVSRRLAGTDRDASVASWRNLFAAFETALRLLHPFMPFLTEELWHRLPQRGGARSIALERFPDPAATWKSLEAEGQVELLQEIVTAARNVRAELKLDPKRRVPADIYATGCFCRCADRAEYRLYYAPCAISELRPAAGHLDPTAGRCVRRHNSNCASPTAKP